MIGRMLKLLPVLALAWLALACQGEEHQQAATPEETPVQLTRLTLRLNWTPYAADHAFFYHGLAQGIYRKHGIDLSIEPGNGSANVLKLVAAGSDPIALVDVSTMARGVAEGMDVKAVMVLSQTSPMAVIYKKDTPIRTAADLRGKKIALTQGDALSQVFPAVLAANGLSERDVQIVSVASPAAKETAVLQGQADALLGWYTEQAPRMEFQSKIPMGWLKFADLGINTMNMAVVVNNRWLQQNRDLVARFVKATQEAIESAVANPQAAADSFVRYVPDFDRGLALKEIQETIPLLRTPNSQGRPWGWTAEADWRSTLELLARFGGVQVKDLQTYYTNEFVQ